MYVIYLYAYNVYMYYIYKARVSIKMKKWKKSYVHEDLQLAVSGNFVRHLRYFFVKIGNG